MFVTAPTFHCPIGVLNLLLKNIYAIFVTDDVFHPLISPLKLLPENIYDMLVTPDVSHTPIFKFVAGDVSKQFINVLFGKVGESVAVILPANRLNGAFVLSDMVDRGIPPNCLMFILALL